MAVIVSGTYTDGAYPHICHVANGGTLTASSSASGTDSDWLLDGETWSIWECGGTVGALSLYFGSTALPVDYIALGAHTFGSSGQTVTPSFMLTDGGPYTAAADVAANAPDDDSALMWLFPERDVYGVRLDFTGSVAPTAAVFSVGTSLVFPRRSVFTGLPISESDQTTYKHQRSLRGDVLQRTVEGSHLEFDMTIRNLSEDFRRSVAWQDLIAHVNGTGTGAAFIVPKPSGYPEDIAYATMTERPRFNRAKSNAAISGEVSFGCVGYSAT